MTLDTGWLAFGGLLLLVAWLVWATLRPRKRADGGPARELPATSAPAPEGDAPRGAPAALAPVPETPAPPPAAAAPAAPIIVPMAKPAFVAAPKPVDAVPPRPAPPAIEPRSIIDPVTATLPPRPKPPVIERVLALERAGAAEWEAAQPLVLTPAQRATVAAVIGSAVAGTAASSPFVVAEFGAGAAPMLARADVAFARAQAEANQRAGLSGIRWLSSEGATSVAAIALAALAGERLLPALGSETQELKSDAAALPVALAGKAPARLKGLLMDLARLAREARDGYASVVAKRPFRERIDEVTDAAVDLWRELAQRADAARQQLEAVSAVPRFGEVQVEGALAAARELQDGQRLQALGARALAAAMLLRAVAGELAPSAGNDPLPSALASIDAGLERDRELAERLGERERSAKGDPYVGKSEFEAKRAALRKLIAAPPAAAIVAARERLAAAQSTPPLDLAGAPGGTARLLIRLGDSAESCELRRTGANRVA